MATSNQSSDTQPSRSLNRQAILEEDEYTEALSHIIARDFFPSLVHLGATNDYLEALRSKDPELIQASVRRLEDLATPASRQEQPWQTPSQTPYAAGPSETPLRTPRGEASAKRPRYDSDLSLDNFQARYTSEDNSSFTQILENENRKRKERWAWAWEAQKRVEEQRGKMLEGRKRLLIEAPPATGVREKFRIEAPALAGYITDGLIAQEETGAQSHVGTDENVERNGGDKEKVVALKERQELAEGEKDQSDVMAPLKDTRPAGVDGWMFKVRFYVRNRHYCYSPWYRHEMLLCSHQMRTSRLIIHHPPRWR